MASENKNIYNLSKSFGVPATHITEGVYIGNIYDAINLEFLNKENIRIIISVMGGLPQMFADKIYVFYPLDQPFGNTKPLAEEAAKVLDKLNGTQYRILVNCLEGVDRSSTIVWRWLCNTSNNLEPYWMNFIKKKRPVACPHPDWFGD